MPSPVDDAVIKSLFSVLCTCVTSHWKWGGGAGIESFSICALVLEEVLPKPARDLQIKLPT